MMILSLIAFVALHGGQYLTPPDDPEADADRPEYEGVFTHPGTGPNVVFSAARWEWWFEFNHEDVLDLDERVAARAGAAWQPVTDDDRQRVALPVLVDALRSGHRDVRAAAVMALGRLGRAAAAPFVEVMLEDKDLFVRTQAVLALGATANAAAVEPLAAILSDESQGNEGNEIRSFAAVGLALVGNDDALTVLASHLAEKVLTRHGNTLRIGLLHAAGVSASEALVPPLLALEASDLLKNDDDARALATQALGQIGSASGLPFVLGRLDDKNNQVRRSAGTALEGLAAHLSPADVERIVAHVPRESDVPARFAMLRALGRTHHAAAREMLRQTVVSGTSIVRPHAALGLGLDGDPVHAGVLLGALGDQHELGNRAALVTSLGLLRAPEALPVLSDLLRREREPSMQAALGLALGLIGDVDPAVVERIFTLAESNHDAEVTRWTIVALGLLGERGRLAALTASLPDVPGTVDRAARAYALGLVGDRTTLAAMAEWARSETEPSYVVAYVLGAMGELCDPRPLSPGGRFSRQVELHHDVGFLMELYRMP